MDFFQKLFDQLKTIWARLSMVQRIVGGAIVAVVLVGILALVSVSSAPTMVPIIDAPIADEAARDRIITRINQENIRTWISATGVIMVEDAATARRMRTILISENLIPTGIDPWRIFDRERWTITDFERNVNLQRAIRQMVTDHIRSLDGVDDANVILVIPRNSLFIQDQNPVTASVSIVPTPGSNITEDRRKIEGIQRMLRLAVEGLKDENIVITDHTGMILNDFENMREWDAQALVERQQRNIRSLEARYEALIRNSLQGTFSADRVRDINVRFDIDMSRRSVSTTRFLPFVERERTPGLAYDDSVIHPSVTRSSETYETTFRGTGFNPEGPPGMEPNVMPAYADVANMHGEVTQRVVRINEEIGREQIEEERQPTINRVTVSVNIDGIWRLLHDERGQPIVLPNNTLEREYIPLSQEVLADAQRLVQDAIGFDTSRGDSVTVLNIQFDRTREFAEADAAFFRQQAMQQTVIFGLIGLTALLVAFIIFRMVSKAIERKRIADEEALARERQAARERALLDAEQDGVEVSLSVEERKRMELQESVVSLAKDHPEDAARLIRTWLLED